jgi:excisionase family DNA binding protein
MADMLTAKDIQDLLQVDRSTVYRMAEAGRLPAVKVGKQWRFPGNLVEHWLQSQVATPPLPVQAQLYPEHDNLAELLPLSCVQLILDTYADALEVMMVVTDMAGNPITQVSHPCGLFKALERIADAVQKCTEHWRTLAETINLEPQFHPSHLGLLGARGLIRVGSELKGMVVVGGIAPEAWPPTCFQIQAMATEFKVKPERISPYLSEVFFLNQAEQTRLLSFTQRIANIVAHIASERQSLRGKLAS